MNTGLARNGRLSRDNVEIPVPSREYPWSEPGLKATRQLGRGQNLRNSPAIKIPRDNESWYFGTGTKNRGTVPSRPLPISGPGTSWKFEISVKMLKVFETFLKKVPILANFPYKSSICRLGSVIKRVIKMRGQFEVKCGHLWLSRFCHFRRFSHFSWFNALKRVRFTPFHSFWHYRRSLGDVGKN